jgi:hypothetical protein
MKPALVVLAITGVLVAAIVGIDQLSDLTQTRADHVDESLASEIVFEIHTQAYDGTVAEAAAAQWQVCAGTIGGEVREPGLEQLDDTSFRVTVLPAVGTNGQRRLVGCLDDAVVDRVISSFVSMEDVPAQPG